MYEKERKLHKELWAWVMEHPDLDREDWPRWEANQGNVKDAYNNCIACDIAKKLRESVLDGKDNGMCFYCPIKWNRNNACIDNDSLWVKYTDSLDHADFKTAALIAKEIRDVQWKRSVPAVKRSVLSMKRSINS